MPRRIAILLATAIPLGLWAVLPMTSAGAPSQRQLQSRIDQKRHQIEARRGREQVLTTDIAAVSSRMSKLEGEITALQVQQVRLEAGLAARRAELERVQRRLREERLRLARLRARLAEARTALAARLVLLYKADRPDIVTVALNSNGFEDLLERTAFMERVSSQDARILARVRAAKADARATAARLAALESRARQLAAELERRRDAVVLTKSSLAGRRDRYAAARADKRSALVSTRTGRQELQEDVGALQAQQARIAATLQRASQAAAPARSGGAPAGPVRSGAGGFVWPVNGPITSQFCERRSWESCHPGMDIAAPEGTPIRAAAAGRVVLLQPVAASGGYGNYTCIQHSASLSTCYAHQSRFGTSMGASVARGQVIGYVGNTGRSFGAHLHFEARVNGSVVNPMNYL